MHLVMAVMPWLIGLGLFSVVAVLITGLISMASGGEFNRRYGNQLMRLRILTQAVTVALVMAYFLLSRL